jgi:Plasmid encoded RepA protein
LHQRAQLHQPLARAGSLIENLYPDLLISKQKLRKIEGIELVRLSRDQGRQNLGFTSRPFVLCGLPLRRPPKHILIYERRNGHFKLQITGHPEFGLPFGQDRLIPIFLATLAVRQQSQTVRFKSGATILDTFGLAKGGKEYRRIVAGFERIFGATIFFGTEEQANFSRVVHRARFNFIQQARIWYDGGSGEDNLITLSSEFFEEVKAHPIPADLDVAKLLAGAPGAFDFYLWLSYRSFTTKGVQSIPLFGDCGLASQLGCSEYSRERRFRAILIRWLHEIRAIWPECPATLEPAGRCLQLRPNARALLNS